MRLIEHYLSVQGEGLHSGLATYFVRFARCNLRCSWCDSAYTFGNGKEVSLQTVAAAIRSAKTPYVCLTGGEPLLHTADCLRLIKKFPKLYFDIETGGSLDIFSVQKKNTSVIMDWKLSDSKMTRKMLAKNLALLRPKQDLLKLVTTGSAKERKEILEIIETTKNSAVKISLQPVQGFPPQKLVEWMLSLHNPRLQLNLQLHKYIWPEKQRGV